MQGNAFQELNYHHHHPLCLLKGGRVVSTPFSTLFCRQLCPDPPTYHHASRRQSIHRFLGRPLLLVPGSLRSADHLTNSFSSILFTCPYHLSLHSRIFSLRSAIFNSHLMSSFLILSRLVTPLMAPKYLISTTFNFFTRSSFTAQVSAPYSITGLTIVLYTYTFSLIKWL